MNNMNLGKDVLNDIEMFQSYTKETESNTVINQFELSMPNKSCKTHLEYYLKNPIHDIDILQSRQIKLKLINNILKKHETSLTTNFKIIEELEKDILWIMNYEVNENDVIDSFDTVYFKWKYFLKFNESKYLLNLKNINTIIITPLFSLLSPLISILIPYLVLRFKFKIQVPFVFFMKTVFNILINTVFSKRNLTQLQCVTCVLSILIYFQSIYNMVDNAKKTYKVLRYISDKVQCIRKYIIASKSILITFDCKDNIRLADDILKVDNDLVLFKKLRENIDCFYDKFKTFIHDINELFAYLTIVNNINEHDLCFSEFKIKNKIYLETENMYHLCLKSSVKNNLKLSDENCIITGPNAAGKSTFIKSLVLNVLLSQSFGVACASKFILTPFYHVNTQFNIPDIKGKESLFEAEMNRCKNNFDILSKLTNNEKCLFVMDEIFNSTNALEGVSGAYGVLKKMSTYPNACNIVTTHYGYLTKLKNFKRLKMEKNKESFDYKIKSGISKQFLAIEMLKNNFDEEVVSEAIKIKNKLLV